MTPTAFYTSIDIDMPVPRVWQVMRDVDSWHEWTPSIRSIKRLKQQPLAVGTRVSVRQPGLPPAFWKVSRYTEQSEFIWVSNAPGLRSTGIHRVEPIPGGSRATLGLEFHGLFSGVAWRFARDIVERYVTLEAEGLKSRSENPIFHRSAL